MPHSIPVLQPKRAICVMILFATGLAAFGCTPRVVVRANPQPEDRGIRYYRPKPFLKVEPAEVAIDKDQTSIVPGVVRISLVYLPDFSEEYSIDVRSGLGVANVGITLEDGWNLTEISQELDSQTDENVEAAASLLSAVGSVVPTSVRSKASNTPSFTVPSRNVPIGLYESIIGLDSNGCKRLYGFRYVGFVPFGSCPINMGGSQSACCDDPNSGLFGLVFVDGQMVFQPLAEMAHTPAMPAAHTQSADLESTRARAATARGPVMEAIPSNPPTLPLSEVQLRTLELELRAHLTSIFDSIGQVRATSQGDQSSVFIQIPAGIAPLPIQRTAEKWLEDNVGPSYSFGVELTNP